MCETPFSALTKTKTKHRSRLPVDSDLESLLVTTWSENW